MSNTFTIYHNPRCSKSRETLKLLEQAGITPEVVRYLETPPDATTLRELLRALSLAPRELMRTKEKEYRQLNLNDPALSEDELIAAMIAHPKLIERPIVVRGEHAVLGRPPAKVHRLIDDESPS